MRTRPQLRLHLHERCEASVHAEDTEAQREAVPGPGSHRVPRDKEGRPSGREVGEREQGLGGRRAESHLQARIRVQSAKMHIFASSLRAC